MERVRHIHGKYYFSPIIKKLKQRQWTNEQIAEMLDCSISTVKYILQQAGEQTIEQYDNGLGEAISDRLRISGVHYCMAYLSVRGWQVAEADPMCVYDVFGIKNDSIIKIQIKTSNQRSVRGWPIFKTSKMHYNMTTSEQRWYQPGDFDFWFFHADNQSWLMPFDIVTNKSTLSMEGMDKYLVV